MTKVMAIEWPAQRQRERHRATYFETPLVAMLRNDPERFRFINERTPMGRWGSRRTRGDRDLPASKASDFITGQTIYVDGGGPSGEREHSGHPVLPRAAAGAKTAVATDAGKRCRTPSWTTAAGGSPPSWLPGNRAGGPGGHSPPERPRVRRRLLRRHRRGVRRGAGQLPAIPGGSGIHPLRLLRRRGRHDREQYGNSPGRGRGGPSPPGSSPTEPPRNDPFPGNVAREPVPEPARVDPTTSRSFCTPPGRRGSRRGRCSATGTPLQRLLLPRDLSCREDDVGLVTLPLFHVTGLNSQLVALLACGGRWCSRRSTTPPGCWSC